MVHLHKEFWTGRTTIADNSVAKAEDFKLE